MKKKMTILTIVILSAIFSAFSGSVTINGTVTDTNGRALAGVMVMAEGAKDHALTDHNGHYAINVEQQSDILIFSLKGFQIVKEKIGGRKIINITLRPESTNLYEETGKSREMVKSNIYPFTPQAYSIAMDSRAGDHGLTYDFNREGYSPVNENGYRSVINNPLSTFSIDVDNASYSNIRRYINMGHLPPPDAVRIEEMINYFRFDYPDPQGDHPFSVYTELAVCPWNHDHQILHVGLQGEKIDKSSLPPSNLVFLIDVSGSMRSVNKLPLLKSALGLLVNELRDEDRVAIVVYAGAAGVVLESTPGNRKEMIMEAIDRLTAGGSTAGGAGLRLAYAEAEKHFVKEGNNRIILATDGDFNVGESSNGSMERLVEEKRKKGIAITVLGFGTGNIQDDKMEIIADHGDGNYAYIDNLLEARKVLVSEFGGTLFTIAKDVKFQIEFNPEKVEYYRLIGYENRMLNDEDFNDDTEDAGEMGSGHSVTALYELIPPGTDERVVSIDPLKYRSNRNDKRDNISGSNEYLTIKVRYKIPGQSTSILFQKPVGILIDDIDNISDNLKFAAAVSEFGMILRNSEYKGDATLGSAAHLAESARGSDEEGYRSEMIRLINLAGDMKIVADKR